MAKITRKQADVSLKVTDVRESWNTPGFVFDENRAVRAIDVSVTVPSYRAQRYIGDCIDSVLAQTFEDFELIVVEDYPPDGTCKFIERIRDKRIRYFKSPTHLGIAGTRNACIQHSRGKYVFFTDADCTVSGRWIQEGLVTFRQPNCVGVEGRVCYVSEDYKPTYSDAIRENRTGGRFMTGSMAYKRRVIEQLGGFDTRYTYMEDRDLALRAMKCGRIYFNPRMAAYHRKNPLTPFEFVRQGARIKNRVLLYKRRLEKPPSLWRITFPLNLIAIMMPLLVFGSVLRHRYSKKEDLALMPFIYVRLVYERLTFWEMCARQRVFLV